MMEQANLQQVSDQALQTKSGEVAMPIGSEERTLEAEAGGVSRKEPKTYLPKSRKAFHPLNSQRWDCTLMKSSLRW